MNLKSCSSTAGSDLEGDSGGGDSTTFQNLGFWCVKENNQDPVLRVFHTEMCVVKGSNKFLKIKEI